MPSTLPVAVSGRPHYQSYLLRIWRPAEGVWRIELETFNQERLVFDDLAALTGFLRQQAWPDQPQLHSSAG